MGDVGAVTLAARGDPRGRRGYGGGLGWDGGVASIGPRVAFEISETSSWTQSPVGSS